MAPYAPRPFMLPVTIILSASTRTPVPRSCASQRRAQGAQFGTRASHVGSSTHLRAANASLYATALLDVLRRRPCTGHLCRQPAVHRLPTKAARLPAEHWPLGLNTTRALQSLLFGQAKSRRMWLQKKKAANLSWTVTYRRMHKKDQSQEVNKRKRRNLNSKKPRAIVGASLEVRSDYMAGSDGCGRPPVLQVHGGPCQGAAHVPLGSG